MIESPTQQKLTRKDKNSKRLRSSYCAKVGAAAKKNGTRGRGKGRGGEGRGKSYFVGRSHGLKYVCVRRLRVFTIYKNFPKNLVGTVDETRLFGSFHWKISGSNGKGNPVFPDGMFQMEIRVLFL